MEELVCGKQDTTGACKLSISLVAPWVIKRMAITLDYKRSTLWRRTF